MPIVVSEDETEIGGYAFIDLGKTAKANPPKFAIRRLNAEPRHLGLDGNWQSEIAWHAPESHELRAASSVLRVGPLVVDAIEELVPIEILIQDESSYGKVDWPYITPSPFKGRVTIGNGEKPPAGPIVGKVKPPPPPPLTPPLVEEATPETTTVDTVADKPPVLPDPPKPDRKLPTILALLLLLAAAGVAAMYSDPVKNLIWPLPVPIARAECEQRYQRLSGTTATPMADFVSLGEECLRAGHGSIAFRLFEEADHNTSESTAWHLGQFYDPGVTDAAYRQAAAPAAARAIGYYAAWKGRSERHTTRLKELCLAQQDLLSRNARIREQCR